MRTFKVTKPGGDEMRLTILDDGTLKIDTDGISMPNHTNAEGFLRQISQLAGGTTEVRVKGGDLRHALHAHTHDGHTHTH